MLQPTTLPERIGLFLPNWIGDAAMATPALRALRLRFPRARLIGIGRPHLGDLLAGTEWIDGFLYIDPRGSESRSRGWRFLRRLRGERLDTAVLFPNSLRSAIWARLSGARRRVGFVRGGRGWLLTD